MCNIKYKEGRFLLGLLLISCSLSTPGTRRATTASFVCCSLKAASIWHAPSLKRWPSEGKSGTSFSPFRQNRSYVVGRLPFIRSVPGLPPAWPKTQTEQSNEMAKTFCKSIEPRSPRFSSPCCRRAVKACVRDDTFFSAKIRAKQRLDKRIESPKSVASWIGQD